MSGPTRSTRALRLWYVLTGLGGFLFGLIAERRPFGNDVFAHPVVIYFVLVGLCLIALRVVAKRPVPELIPERSMLLGFACGLALFLVGNFLAVHLLR
ncbi:MAG TPA: hypothetical protein VFB45_10955 [Pseudolabrys sp.]|nr:hypothetical protein [Pseudolabrys sp.]